MNFIIMKNLLILEQAIQGGGYLYQSLVRKIHPETAP